VIKISQKVQQEYLYFPVQKSGEKNIQVTTIIVDLKLLILQLFFY